MTSTTCLAGLLVLCAAATATAQVSTRWPQHAMDRPQPRIVGPAPIDRPDAPPTDAVVLFDGSDLSQWAGDSGQAAPWKVENGYAEVVPGSGFIHTRRGFGDCQLHIEWAAPLPPHGEGQERGNSGVFLMGRYEVQVLDSYDNKTYPDGQAAAVYGQSPPLVNATRPPGEWQSYDIVFHRPRFDARGRVTKPARLTVFHNGVLVQDNFELSGPTAHQERPPYLLHPDTLSVGQRASRSLKLTAYHVASYAELSGDRNPLHFDESFALATGKLDGLIVQGGLTTGLLHALVAMDLPGPGSVFLSQNWKFTAPVYIGDTITAEAEVLSVHATKPVCQLAVRVTRQTGETVLEGEAWCYRFTRP